MTKKILLVGAGAVGLVYGRHLADAGNEVSFLIKEKYVDDMVKGAVLYHINRDKHRQKPVRFSRFGTQTSWQAASEIRWDMIILCISSAALHDGFDFAGLKMAMGDATLVMLQPGPEDMALVRQHIDTSRIVQGMITLISYHTPMPGEQTSEPGTAYWLPPVVPMPFAGPVDRRSAVIQAFVKAGIAAKSVSDLRTQSLHSTAFFMTFLTALEASGWKFRQLRDDSVMIARMLEAAREASAAIAAKHGIPAPFWLGWVSPWMIKSLLRVAPHALPLDLEMFFQVHFTKVKTQTKMFLGTYLRDAKAAGLSAGQLSVLNSYT
jgi:ketopantoate reductase